MELAYKEDWPQARERYEAWWQGEIVDRAVIQVIAPDAKLYYNDYGCDQNAYKFNGLLSLVEYLRGRYVPIDGVGLQMHLASISTLP